MRLIRWVIQPVGSRPPFAKMRAKRANSERLQYSGHDALNTVAASDFDKLAPKDLDLD